MIAILGYATLYITIQVLQHPALYSHATGSTKPQLDQILAKKAQEDVNHRDAGPSLKALLDCKATFGLPGPLDERQRLFLYSLVECTGVIQFQSSPSSRDLYQAPDMNTLQGELEKNGKIRGNCYDIAVLTNAVLRRNGFQSELRYQPNHVYIHISDYNVDFNKQDEAQIKYEQLDIATLSVVPLWGSVSKLFFALILLTPFHDKRPVFFLKVTFSLQVLVWAFFAPHHFPMLMLYCATLYFICVAQLLPLRVPIAFYRLSSIFKLAPSLSLKPKAA